MRDNTAISASSQDTCTDGFKHAPLRTMAAMEHKPSGIGPCVHNAGCASDHL